MEIRRGLGTQWVRARGRPVGSAKALPEEGFHEAVTVGTAGDGGGPGNVTLNPFASSLLRGLLAAGDSGQCGGGPSQALDAGPGCAGPRSARCQGICFLTEGLGSLGPAPCFPSLLSNQLWFLILKKIKGTQKYKMLVVKNSDLTRVYKKSVP